MNPLRTLAAVAWWLGLIAWIGAIVMPGATAMVAFTRLPQLDLSMTAANPFFAGDSEGAGRFIAGYVTNPLFQVSDTVRLWSLIAVGVAIVASFGRPVGRPGLPRRIAVIAIGLAALVLGWYLLRVSGPLALSLDAWRTAVLADDAAAAEAAWVRFDPLHRTASRLFGLELGLVLVAAVSAAVSTRPGPAIEPGTAPPKEERT